MLTAQTVSASYVRLTNQKGDIHVVEISLISCQVA